MPPSVFRISGCRWLLIILMVFSQACSIKQSLGCLAHHASAIEKPGHSLTGERHATSSHRQNAVASISTLLAGYG